MSTRPDTVLLDIDGTLVDSTYVHALAWMRAFRRIGEHPLWADVHRAVGLGGDKLVAHVLDEDAEGRIGDDARSMWADEYAGLVSEVAAVPGASELVDDLRHQGLRVALASSGAQRFTDDAMKILGISRDGVDAVTTADDVDESKPEPDLLGVALHRSGGSRGVLVGDTTWDVDAATKAGMACVGVLTGGFSESELRSAGAADVVATVADLIGFDWHLAHTRQQDQPANPSPLPSDLKKATDAVIDRSSDG